MRLPIFAVLLGFMGAMPTSAYSQVMNESDCQLEYLKGVQSTLAVNLIYGACRHLSNWSSTMELGRNERLYNECLLTKLQGVLNDQAATWVAQACRKKNSFTLQ